MPIPSSPNPMGRSSVITPESVTISEAQYYNPMRERWNTFDPYSTSPEVIFWGTQVRFRSNVMDPAQWAVISEYTDSSGNDQRYAVSKVTLDEENDWLLIADSYFISTLVGVTAQKMVCGLIMSQTSA